jgi:hypothetical protein
MALTPQYGGERTTPDLKDKAADQVGKFVARMADEIGKTKT